MKFLRLTILLGAVLLSTLQVKAFCGFYVAKADAKLFNNRSEVILVRNGDRTVVTMSNDFRGDVKDFAMVVPVPVLLKQEDIRVVNRNIFDKLNDYSAPRLVEYYDAQPCAPVIQYEALSRSVTEDFASVSMAEMVEEAEMDYNVTIEARYEVGEYEILLLSAQESTGLRRWLNDNDYKIPENADDVLDPYIRSNMKFFVVKVNFQKLAGSMPEYLSPIQITYNSPRFMLPIRLGMANADGPQDLVVYALTDQGRVECTNYRTVELPTSRNIPLFVKEQFGDFYKDLYKKRWKMEGENAVFLEYAWDVSPQTAVKCDPCIGPPPVPYELLEAGVNWLNNGSGTRAFFTRLHVRYERDKFPQDLQFQTTTNQERFQCRYILTHPAQGDMSCEAGQAYLEELSVRRKREMDELYALTGWTVKHGDNYIGEFENRRMKRNDMIPISDFSGGRGLAGPLMIIATFLMIMALSAFISQHRFKAVFQ